MDDGRIFTTSTITSAINRPGTPLVHCPSQRSGTHRPRTPTHAELSARCHTCTHAGGRSHTDALALALVHTGTDRRRATPASRSLFARQAPAPGNRASLCCAHAQRPRNSDKSAVDSARLTAKLVMRPVRNITRQGRSPSCLSSVLCRLHPMWEERQAPIVAVFSPRALGPGDVAKDRGSEDPVALEHLKRSSTRSLGPFRESRAR